MDEEESVERDGDGVYGGCRGAWWWGEGGQVTPEGRRGVTPR